MSREAVIVSVARTPIAKAYRGAFNNLTSPTMAAHAINAALNKINLDGSEVDDCIFGAALQQGSQWDELRSPSCNGSRTASFSCWHDHR